MYVAGLGNNRLTIRQSSFANNSALQDGGALCVANSNAEVVIGTSNFISNQGNRSAGAAFIGALTGALR